MQARLGRKNPSEEMQRQIPVIYVAFDVLAVGPGGGAAVEPTLRLPLRERRQRLDASGPPACAGHGNGQPAERGYQRGAADDL